MDAKTKQLLDDIDSSLTRLVAERDALRRASQIDSLDDCVAALNRVSDYLDNRDDCWDENISNATDALFTAIRRIQCRAEEIDDEESDGDLFAEMKRDDDRARIADIRAEQRRG